MAVYSIDFSFLGAVLALLQSLVCDKCKYMTQCFVAGIKRKGMHSIVILFYIFKNDCISDFRYQI